MIMFLLTMFLLSFLLPIGAWAEFEGHEIIGFIFLFFGWMPIAVLIGDQLMKNEDELKKNEDR